MHNGKPLVLNRISIYQNKLIYRRIESSFFNLHSERFPGSRVLPLVSISFNTKPISWTGCGIAHYDPGRGIGYPQDCTYI